MHDGGDCDKGYMYVTVTVTGMPAQADRGIANAWIFA